jgi:hypothetical protein
MSFGFKRMNAYENHYNGILGYNAHNLYGVSKASVMRKSLKIVSKKIPNPLCVLDQGPLLQMNISIL